MLTYIHNPAAFIEQKSVAELLSKMDKEALVGMIAKMVDKDPDLYFWLLTAVHSATAQDKPVQTRMNRKTQLSKTEYRRQIQSILRSLRGCRHSEAYWRLGGMVSQLRQVRESADAFLESGDAAGALLILTTLLIEVWGSYGEFDDSDGELGSFLDELALPMVEAVLSADLSKNERRSLMREFEPVIAELSADGMDDLDVILAALKGGWSENPMTEDEDDCFDSGIFNEAKLNILERQNRMEDFLHCCLATGEHLRNILKQLELGEFESAIEAAWKSLTHPGDGLQVGRKLRDSGRL